MYWKQKSLLERIQDRWTEMDDKYSKVNRNRDMIVRYFRCDEVLEVDDQGNFVGDDIYNASGMWFSQMMARGFQGTFVPKNIPWLDYQIDSYELQGIDPLDEWTQEVAKFMSEDYQRSNFYDVQPQFILDSITTGSPVMFGDEDILGRRVMWTPVHYKNVRVFYSKWNEAEGVIQKDPQWTAKQIFDKFIGNDDEAGTRRRKMLPSAINNALDAGRLNDEYVVYRAVFKSDDPIWKGWDHKPKGQWPWLSVYFCEMAEVDNEQKERPLNQDMGYFSQPFVVNDYDKKLWEVVARTPAWYAIWDNLGLQDMDMAFRENMQLKNRPPRYALSEMAGRIDFSSEGITFVDNEEYKMPPKALDMIGDVQLNEKLVELNEGKLKRWFMADMWHKFTELVRTNKQPVTAAQIWEMVAEKSTQLSPAIESYSKYLKSSDARHVDVASRRGEYPFDPQTMQEISYHVISNSRRPINSIGITPVFVNALVQAQKRAQQMEPILSGVQAIRESGLVELHPSTRHIIKPYETADEILQAAGFPQSCVNPEEEFNQIAAAEQQAALQQQQFDNAIELAKASKPASDAVGQLAEAGE